MQTSPCSSRSGFFRMCTLLITIASVCGLFLPPGLRMRAQRNVTARMGNPRPGAPEGDFPNLDEVKRRPAETPRVRPELPSSIRSKRNPIEPWNKRFPLPLPQVEEQQIGARPTAQQQTIARREIQARRQQSFQQKRKAHHPTSRAIRSAALPLMTDDTFIQSFFNWALVRSPDATETPFWNDELRRGYANSQSALILAAVELGKTLFESAEYATRNRDNHW
jgi:hypothetical protein